jgi:eukaryotic-like serine/threonine-protein kinase
LAQQMDPSDDRTRTIPPEHFWPAESSPKRYTLMERLGEGGMGVVYRAYDPRLRRYVALKFVSQAFTQDPATEQALANEARAAAALDHPNICTIYEIGKLDGRRYISMSYVPGMSLKQKLKNGGLPFEEALELATQIAMGLEAAHQAGVIHRDVKPSNVLVTNGGAVRIVDFGLAVLAKQPLRSGDISGTPAYMSPEQAYGLELDHRADLWSLGVTIYQMVTGTLPFRGRDISALRQSFISHVDIPPPPDPTEAYRLMEPVIRRALVPDRTDRYPSATAMIADLKELASARAVATARPALPSVAVLPFSNLGAEKETEYFSDGLTGDLIAALAQLDGLRVVSRGSAFEFKGKPVDVRDVSARLNVTKVLEGTVRVSGSRVRVTAQLTDASDGFNIWSEMFDRQIVDVFEIQDEITHAIVEKLRVRLSSDEQRRLNSVWPGNIEAYDLYLKGKFQWYQQTADSFRQSIEYFTRAVQVDPQFAAAHAGLADCYTFLAFHGFGRPRDIFESARTSAAHALEINPSLPGANIAMGCVKLYHDWDRTAAEGYLRRAIELNPGYGKAHYSLMLCLVQTGRFEEGRVALDRALELDPGNMLYHTSAGWLEYYAKRPRVAIEKLEQALELNPNYPETQVALGAVSEQLGLYPDAFRHLERAAEAYGQHPLVVAFLGAAYATAGHREEALKELALLDSLAAKQFVPHVCRAIIQIACGDYDVAFAELALAKEDRDAFLCWLNVYPGIEPLRSDPRFIRLLEDIGLTR